MKKITSKGSNNLFWIPKGKLSECNSAQLPETWLQPVWTAAQGETPRGSEVGSTSCPYTFTSHTHPWTSLAQTGDSLRAENLFNHISSMAQSIICVHCLPN